MTIVSLNDWLERFESDASPDYPTVRRERPRIISVQFGDGYEQRAPDGLNYKDHQQEIVWTNLRQEVAEHISMFFDNRRGTDTFRYRFPNPRGTEKENFYVCKEWEVALTDTGAHRVTARMQRVWT